MIAQTQRNAHSGQANVLFSRDGLLCAALFAFCLIATHPSAEVGINDDWVYTITTLDFARTGHIVFHGWASPMLGWQALWGALFAHLFGFTFTAVRLSTIPVAVAAVLLYHAILRRFGLNSAHASFGTLAFALSPVFLPLSVTFMTDIPSVFAILLCVYLCQLAIAARTAAMAILWLVAAALTNIAFGTVRQIAWLGVLVIVPSCGWLLRRRRNAATIAIALWLLGIACIYAMTSWFARQPFTAPETLLPPGANLHVLRFLSRQLLIGAMTTLLLIVPVLAMGLTLLRHARRRLVLQAAIAFLAFAALYVGLHRHNQAHLLDFPWAGNTFGIHGILQDPPLFGSQRILPRPLLLLLLAFIVVSALALWDAFSTHRNKFSEAAETDPRALRWSELSILLLPFLAAYCALLLPRAAFFILFDRYLLEVVAVLLIFILRWHQERISTSIPRVAILVLAVIGVLTTAGTHDLFAINRAQVQAASELQQAGVPREEIQGGFAFDMTTQVYAWGYVNDPRILNPATAYHPQPNPPPNVRDGVFCGNPVQRYLPALHIRYVISADPSPCLGPSSYAAVTYRTWLPPAKRQLIIGELLPPPSAK